MKILLVVLFSLFLIVGGGAFCLWGDMSLTFYPIPTNPAPLFFRLSFGLFISLLGLLTLGIMFTPFFEQLPKQINAIIATIMMILGIIMLVLFCFSAYGYFAYGGHE